MESNKVQWFLLFCKTAAEFYTTAGLLLVVTVLHTFFLIAYSQALPDLLTETEVTTTDNAEIRLD